MNQPESPDSTLEEVAFQASLLALNAALAAASENTSQEAPARSRPPATIGHRVPTQKSGQKDFQG
jgi:hypothetical protein